MVVDEDEESNGECSGQKPPKDQEGIPCDIEAIKSSDLLTTNQETINYQEVSSPYNAMPLNNNNFLIIRVKKTHLEHRK